MQNNMEIHVRFVNSIININYDYIPLLPMCRYMKPIAYSLYIVHTYRL